MNWQVIQDLTGTVRDSFFIYLWWHYLECKQGTRRAAR